MPTTRLSVVGHHCSRLPALGPSLAPPGSPLTAHLLQRSAPPSSISSSCATCRVPHCIVQLRATNLLILTLVRHACGVAFPESTTFTPPPQPYLVFGLRSALLRHRLLPHSLPLVPPKL
jgi:hypothetical protein